MRLDGADLRDITSIYYLPFSTNPQPTMNKSNTDYTAYLVTDSTMVPESATFLFQVEKAVENGATIVQLREKNILTLEFIERARKVLEITRPRGLPLIINDRVDVALAVDADGVHVGQDDMPATLVRSIIGNDKILGVSCGTVQEVEQVVGENVADYVGLGTLYPTLTKNVKNVCGPIGIRRMLEALDQDGEKIGRKILSVAIGGINALNAAKVKFQCLVPGRSIDGVAVVSCIMASTDPGESKRKLVSAIKAPVPWIWNGAGKALSEHRKPLVHHITNNVVKNFSANVTLAVGASPIMSELPEEFGDFASLQTPVSLVLNLGTPSPLALDMFVHALTTYNQYGAPVVFDPVAAGATKPRLEACRRLLNAGQFSVIKGNLGEIMALDTLASESSQSGNLMQGVDSLVDSNSQKTPELCKRVAREFRTVVVVTGEINYIYDGTGEGEVRSVKGGSSYMGLITGTGCSLGSVIAAKVAVAKDENTDIGQAVEDAVTHYNQAGARAAQNADGPGTFMVQFLNELSR